MIDATGKFLIPGLWDMHVHLRNDRNLRSALNLLLANGVTGMRHMGGNLEFVIAVGPWKFGEASVVDLIKLHTEWYDWTMKNGPKPAFLKKNVAYYAIGPEEWLYADNLDAIPTTSRKFYLGSKGGQLSEKQPGSLTEVPGPDSSPDSYKYDPLEIDYDEEVGRAVLYETGPFAEDTDIVGQMKVVAWMSLDVPDTDFSVWIGEIDPAGKVVGPVYDDLIRARYRESLRKEKLVNRVKLTDMNSII